MVLLKDMYQNLAFGFPRSWNLQIRTPHFLFHPRGSCNLIRRIQRQTGFPIISGILFSLQSLGFEISTG